MMIADDCQRRRFDEEGPTGFVFLVAAPLVTFLVDMPKFPENDRAENPCFDINDHRRITSRIPHISSERETLKS